MTLPPKKLSFKNRWLVELVQATPDETDCLPMGEQFFFPDMTTRVNLIWNVNQEEFTKVFSSVMYGADLAYPDCSINAMAIFLRMVCENLELCTEISDCINTSDEVQQSLAQFLSEQEGGTNGKVPTPISPSESAANLLPDNYTCDDAHLCGMARWIVNNLHDGTVQLIQQYENSTNLWELLTQFVDNVEGVSWFGSALEFALWAQDQLEEYYQLNWSTTVEDELTCDVFCAIQPNCEVTLDGLISAYENAITASFSLPTVLDNINDLWNWVSALDYSTALSKSVVASFHWVVLQALRFGTSALGFTAGIRTLKAMIATGADETDTYCNSNCACSTSWCNLFDFTAGQQSFDFTYPSRPYGVYVASAGFEMQYANVSGINDWRCYIRRVFSQSFTVNSVSWTYKATTGNSNRQTTLIGLLNGNQVFLHAFPDYDLSGNPQTYVHNGTHTIDELRWVNVCDISGSGFTSDVYTLENIKIEGDTGNPPEPTNC